MPPLAAILLRAARDPEGPGALERECGEATIGPTSRPLKPDLRRGFEFRWDHETGHRRKLRLSRKALAERSQPATVDLYVVVGDCDDRIVGTGESAVSSGVRRIEALTGRHARHHANDTIALAKSAAGELRTTIDEMPARITALMEERKKLERDLSDAKKKLAMGGGAQAAGGDNGVRSIGDIKLLARAVSGIDLKDLRSLADEGKKQVGSGVVAIVGTTDDGKAGVVVGVTPDLTSRFSAVDLVRKGAEALGGKGGGGRPDMAQAGGPDGAKAAAALSAIEKAIGSAQV